MKKLSILLVIILTSGCAFKEAATPYTQAPTSPHSVWKAPEKALTRIHIVGEEVAERKDIEAHSKKAPLTLAEILDIALTSNPDTKASWAKARAEAAIFGQSLQNYFVLASINGLYQMEDIKQFHSNTMKKDTEFINRDMGGQLNLSYILLDFGQTRYSSKAALESLFSADWSHNSVIQQTMKSVMDHFYDYLLEKQLLIANEMDLVNATTTLDSTKEKFKSGLADISDIVQATTSYLQQQLNLVNQEGQLHNAYTQLVDDMGYSANSEFIFQNFPKEILTFTPEKLDTLISQALINRPDLQAKESVVKAKEASLKAAQAGRMPIVNANLDWGREFHHYPLTGRGVTKYTASVSLKFPLFQGFFISNKIKQSRSELTLALSELKKIKLGIEQEVSNYRTHVILASKALDYAEQYLLSAQEDYRVFLEKYRAGTTNIVDLIAAQTSVSDARARKAKSEQQWYRSVADLTYSLGLLLPSRVNKREVSLNLVQENPCEQ